MDVTRQAVSKWEQGAGHPETEKLILLAKVLNTSLDQLFAEELACKEKADIQRPIPHGVVAGLQAFSSKINDLMSSLEKKDSEEKQE